MINKLLRKFTNYQITSKYLYRLDSFSLNLITYFTRMYDKIKHLEGDIVECGVGKGRSFMVLGFLARNQHRELVGYDSFEGFPEPSEEDNSPRNPKKGEWNYIKPFDVFESFKTAYVNSDDLQVVGGFFKTTIPMYQGQIALLHLDCDLYESYQVCLKHLYPKVVKGGIVLFDEYNDPNWPGATKAVDEYGLKPIKDEESGKYYCIK